MLATCPPGRTISVHIWNVCGIPTASTATSTPHPSVNANTTPMLLKLVASGRLNVDTFATHHFRLDEMMDAYDTFGRAAETRALKVVIDR